MPEIFEIKGDVLPCVKCRSNDLGVFRIVEWNGPSWYAIQCSNCKNSSQLYVSVEDAAEDWNRKNDHERAVEGLPILW